MTSVAGTTAKYSGRNFLVVCYETGTLQVAIGQYSILHLSGTSRYGYSLSTTIHILICVHYITVFSMMHSARNSRNDYSPTTNLSLTSRFKYLIFSLDNTLCRHIKLVIKLCAVPKVCSLLFAVILLTKFEVDNAPTENFANISANWARQ